MVSPLATIRNRLHMRHLRLLKALADKGSLRGAAEVLSVSQPAATKALQELELLVGVELFIRHPRGLVSTIFGEAMTRYAATVLEDLGALQHELAAVEDGNIGRVRIGMIPAAAPGLLTRTALSLRVECPRLEMALQVNTSDILVHDLQHGMLDIVIGRIPPGWPADQFSFTHLAAEPLTIVTRIGHPACDPENANRANLERYPWILQPYPSPMRGAIEEVFRSWDAFHPSSVVETSSTLITLSLIRESDMIAVLPREVGSHFVGMGVIAAVPMQLAVRLPPFGIVLRKNREATPAMLRVISAIKREAQAGAAA